MNQPQRSHPQIHLFRASTAVLKGHGTFDHLMVEFQVNM